MKTIRELNCSILASLPMLVDIRLDSCKCNTKISTGGQLDNVAGIEFQKQIKQQSKSRLTLKHNLKLNHCLATVVVNDVSGVLKSLKH